MPLDGHFPKYIPLKTSPIMALGNEKNQKTENILNGKSILGAF